MIIEDIYSGKKEKLYSVLMTPEEIRIFSKARKRKKKQNDDEGFSDLDNLDKATVAGIGSAGLLSTTKTGRLTGKVTRYHNTEIGNVENILNEGIKGKYAADPNNITNKVVGDVDPSKKENLIYTAKKKSLADNVGKHRQQLGGQPGRTLKLEFDYDDIKNSERIANPELRGAKNSKEFREAFKKAKGYDLGYLSSKEAWKSLNDDTHVFRGDIDPKYIVGGKGYKKRTLRQVARYIKNNPGRFSKEAAKVGVGVGLGAYALKKLRDSSNED